MSAFTAHWLWYNDRIKWRSKSPDDLHCDTTMTARKITQHAWHRRSWIKALLLKTKALSLMGLIHDGLVMSCCLSRKTVRTKDTDGRMANDWRVHYIKSHWPVNMTRDMLLEVTVK